MIVPDKNRDPCSVHCWRATALRRRIALFSHDILLSSSHRPCQRESERFSIPPGVKSAHIWRLSSATRSIYLPQKSGWEVLEWVKATPSLSNIPVVMLTGTLSPFDEKERDCLQPTRCLLKPTTVKGYRDL